MHDIRTLRENPELLHDGLRRRGRLEALGPVEHRAEGLQSSAAAKAVVQQLRVLAERADVVHAYSFGMPGANDRKSQLGSVVTRTNARAGSVRMLSTTNFA